MKMETTLHQLVIRRVLLLGLMLLGGGWLQAQSDSTVIISDPAIDSVAQVKVRMHRPGQALKWALIPGGGQVYNRAWWKVPIVYGALFSAIGYADFNNINYQRFVRALEAECFGNNIPDDCEPTDHEFTPFGLNVNSMISLRDRFDRDRQNAYLYILLVYLLQGIEAFSDAHLKTFDIDEDLSLHLKPVVLPGQQLGVGVTIPLGAGLKQKRQLAKLSAVR